VTDQDFLGPVGNASAKYDDGNPLTRALLRRFLAEIDEAVDAAAPASILDVGCGEGVVTERLATRLPAAEVVGIDADDSRLRHEWASRARENLTFRLGSAYDLEYHANAFDLVCALEVLEHLERPEDALAEMARVARRAVLVSVPREPLWRISHVLAGRDIRRFGDTQGHINHWSSRTFAALVSNYGRVNRARRPFPWTIISFSPGESAVAVALRADERP
jgi:ubiquinone/menaquinone biosynthesis C-methylase UbiE